MEYLVTNWGEEVIVAETKLLNITDGCAHVTYSVLWEIMQQAKELDLKLTIHEVGECILDWSGYMCCGK